MFKWFYIIVWRTRFNSYVNPLTKKYQKHTGIPYTRRTFNAYMHFSAIGMNIARQQLLGVCLYGYYMVCLPQMYYMCHYDSVLSEMSQHGSCWFIWSLSVTGAFATIIVRFQLIFQPFCLLWWAQLRFRTVQFKWKTRIPQPWASYQIRKIAGCMPGSPTSSFLWSRQGKTFPAFPAHAQPAILRIW